MCSSDLKERIERGLGHIPEDRHSTAVIMDFSVAENLILMEYDKPPFTHHGLRRPSKVAEFARSMRTQFDIRCPSPRELVKNLSGGNQQKVVVARDLARQPKLLIAAQPSRGLDIGATEFVQKRLLEQRQCQRAVLLISTDLDEVLAVSDRVLVLYKGQVIWEFIPGAATFEQIGLAMAGVKPTTGTLPPEGGLNGQAHN